jgi:hypothetical protein
MSQSNWHISDRELVLAADGELKARRSTQIQRHLRVCWKCSARMAQIESAILDLVETSQGDGPELPPIAASRALLRARLAAMSTDRGRSPWWRWRLRPSAAAYALAVVVLVVAGGQILRKQMPNRVAQGSPEVLQSGILPNPTLTPGATRPISLTEVCSSNHGEVVTPVARQKQREVFAEYGIGNAPSKDYEVDYLITPDLGGADDIRNLWPEPHLGARWNSYAKDQLEDRLHLLVCSGKLSLTVAQQEISKNWIAAYQKYLQTGSPTHL